MGPAALVVLTAAAAASLRVLSLAPKAAWWAGLARGQCRQQMQCCGLVVASLFAALVLGVWLDGVGLKHVALPPQLTPHRPVSVRAINVLGRALGAVGALDALLPLTEESIVRAACSAAARHWPPDAPCPLQRELGDGAPMWRDGLRALTSSLLGDTKLTLLGRVIAREQIVHALTQRAAVLAFSAGPNAAAVAAERVEVCAQCTPTNPASEDAPCPPRPHITKRPGQASPPPPRPPCTETIRDPLAAEPSPPNVCVCSCFLAVPGVRGCGAVVRRR